MSDAEIVEVVSQQIQDRLAARGGELFVGTLHLLEIVVEMGIAGCILVPVGQLSSPLLNRAEDPVAGAAVGPHRFNERVSDQAVE